jgi:hypothetical protein
MCYQVRLREVKDKPPMMTNSNPENQIDAQTIAMPSDSSHLHGEQTTHSHLDPFELAKPGNRTTHMDLTLWSKVLNNLMDLLEIGHAKSSEWGFKFLVPENPEAFSLGLVGCDTCGTTYYMVPSEAFSTLMFYSPLHWDALDTYSEEELFEPYFMALEEIVKWDDDNA